MNAQELAKKQPMAAPGFTVLTPKRETAHDKMLMETQKSICSGCGGERTYPAPATQDVPKTEKKNGKR
jgi:hypothetical protein